MGDFWTDESFPEVSDRSSCPPTAGPAPFCPGSGRPDQTLFLVVSGGGGLTHQRPLKRQAGRIHL
ncbi:hypothetical protein KR100_08340 [Synechococcus sp. KORDI-100]|nr:hypothetical protein KR100_08340 [Synechococcus sp. KORDI-100]